MGKDFNPYIENGYKSRAHYLICMSEQYNVPIDVVCTIADMLGKSEDFDGLISSLEDAESMFGEDDEII